MAKGYHSVALAASVRFSVSKDIERQMPLNARSPTAPQPLFLLCVWCVWVDSLWCNIDSAASYENP